jgi:hypothetical protein
METEVVWKATPGLAIAGCAFRFPGQAGLYYFGCDAFQIVFLEKVEL